MFKKIGLALLIVLIISAFCFAEVKKTVQPTASVTLKDQRDKVSYSIGLNLGKSLKKQEVDVDPKLLFKGISDGLSDAKPLLTDDEIKAVFAAFQKEMNDKRNERQKQLAAKNKTAGDAFLAANKTKEGVVTLPSGLQYKILTAGTGPSPIATDTVTVNYKGSLVDGTEFDSSYKHGKPINIPVSGIIPGWTEAMKLMRVGAKWQLFIPANLAYGEQGNGQTIGPNAGPIFEVELLGITPKATMQPNISPIPTNK